MNSQDLMDAALIIAVITLPILIILRVLIYLSGKIFARKINSGGYSARFHMVRKYSKYTMWVLIAFVVVYGLSSVRPKSAQEIAEEKQREININILREKGWYFAPNGPGSFILHASHYAIEQAKIVAFASHGAADGGGCNFNLPMLPFGTSQSITAMPRDDDHKMPPCVEPAKPPSGPLKN